MAIPEDRERELEQKERELHERERAIRLKELEDELNKPSDPPYYETQKHEKPEGKLKRWSKKLTEIAKFCGIVIAVIVSIRIATWLTTLVIVGGVAWVGYKLFVEGDRSS
ncbi:hypothetical protein IQ235_02535 [Oscillatoriales cyanobacterium LEGE 11467]|uniref:DUF3040 domain-containing protein n=1 Tax=Zarconia navalis LEGE 11467 TaxID=1828826 RepID=A0A928VSX3_9CYAN|nr:hypothetical protein [Zarconia navalis]MBE9039672.1 hypothetical protein [Zarconia navalis LEGE 11467]